MTVQLHQDRIARFLTEVHLRSGSGSGANGKVDVCIMQAVDWIAGGDGKTDAPDCVDPVIRSLCIRLNDAAQFSEWRDDLKPFATRLAGTNAGSIASIKRGFIAADHTIRVVAPLAFEFWAELSEMRYAHTTGKAQQRAAKDRDDARAWAQKLRDVPPIVDKESAIVGRDVAREARKVAAYAASAASAAYAAYARSKAGALKRALWDQALVLLERLIAVTEVQVPA